MDNKKRKLRWQLPFLLLLVVGTIYVIRTNRQATPYQQEEGAIFGTFYHVTYQCDSSLQQEIESELRKVDASLSPFNTASVISRINRNEEVTPDSMFVHVFRLSKEISENTQGAFDITVAPLVNAWGFGFRDGAFPDSAMVDSLLRFTGYRKVRLDASGRILKDDPRLMLTCSAVAKGYAVDVVAQLLSRKGVTSYMVDIGGEVVTRGLNPAGNPWRIGINKPEDDSLALGGALQATLHVTDAAMATSGNYRNFYYRDGKKYAHTVDPRTGYPVQHEILSATVLAPDCMSADAYATAFMVMGLDSACRFVDAKDGLEAYFIYTDSAGQVRTWQSEGMGKYLD